MVLVLRSARHGGDNRVVALVSKQISVGDLVQVVRAAPCCGNDRCIGVPYIVLATQYGRGVCIDCQTDHGAVWWVGGCHHHPLGWHLASRLIRIEPPALPDRVERDEEVSA